MIATTAKAVWDASEDEPQAEEVLAGLKKSAAMVYTNDECLLLVFDDNSCLEIVPMKSMVHSSPTEALNQSYKVIS